MAVPFTKVSVRPPPDQRVSVPQQLLFVLTCASLAALRCGSPSSHSNVSSAMQLMAIMLSVALLLGPTMARPAAVEGLSHSRRLQSDIAADRCQVVNYR